MPSYTKIQINGSSNAWEPCRDWGCSYGPINPVGQTPSANASGVVWGGRDSYGVPQLFFYDIQSGNTSTIANSPPPSGEGLSDPNYGTHLEQLLPGSETGILLKHSHIDTSGKVVWEISLYNNTVPKWTHPCDYTVGYALNSRGDYLTANDGSFGEYIIMTAGGYNPHPRSEDVICVTCDLNGIGARAQLRSFDFNDERQVAWTDYTWASVGKPNPDQLHFWSRGEARLLSNSSNIAGLCGLNERGWVLWAEYEHPTYKLIGGFLFDGNTTNMIISASGNEEGPFGLSDLGQTTFLRKIIENGETKICVFFYDGSHHLLGTGRKFNSIPFINRQGEIVWTAADEEVSTIASLSLHKLYYSNNGSTPELIAEPAYSPTIDDLGNILYWDPDARLLTLLVPTNRPIFWQQLYALVQRRLKSIRYPLFHRQWLASIGRERMIRPPERVPVTIGERHPPPRTVDQRILWKEKVLLETHRCLMNNDWK